MKMRDKQLIQDFNNYFESVLQDIFWVYENQIIIINYKLKLLQNILIRIYINYNKLLSKTFGGLKVII